MEPRLADDLGARTRSGGPCRAAKAVVLVLVGALVILVPACTSGGSTTSASSSEPTVAGSGTASVPTTASAAVAPDRLPSGEDVVVTEVVDGDTLVVTGDQRVRLIGVDTPETRHPDLGVQCYGREASDFTARLLPPGTSVRLVLDVEPLDRYDRLLAYVYKLDDGLFVNQALVAEGYAQVMTVPPNVRHADDFLAAQREARDAGRGLWSACPGEAVEEPVVDTAPGACDPAYPDVCVPPPPPDLDCGDVDARAFTARPPDPHRFDGDGDGIACNS